MGVEGRLKTYSYENDQGQKVYVTEVAIDNLSFLQPKAQKAGYSQQNNYDQYAGYDPGEQIDIQDGDLPF